MQGTQVLPFLAIAEVCKSLQIPSDLNNSNATSQRLSNCEAWVLSQVFWLLLFFLEHQTVFTFTFTLSISDSTYVTP